jgi:hypothetical protein
MPRPFPWPREVFLPRRNLVRGSLQGNVTRVVLVSIEFWFGVLCIFYI